MIKKILLLPIVLFLLIVSYSPSVLAGMEDDMNYMETDIPGDMLVFFFDLRDRETYIQLTNSNFDVNMGDDDDDVGKDNSLHIFIFDVSRDCVENNFFDVYTPNDTHVYNMRDIQTNDGNPSGVVLPDDAYGFVFAQAVNLDGTRNESADIFIGNLRIIANNGYEYRTNGVVEPDHGLPDTFDKLGYFNFNTLGGVTLSDIVSAVFDDRPDGTIEMAEITENFTILDVDILDANENIFSCRNVIYACVNQDSIRLEELLEFVAENADGAASVASSEYGINNAIPHSKGGELLCPGNTVSEGVVKLEVLNTTSVNTLDDNVIWVGLNNGNSRGSLDVIWVDNTLRGDDDDG